MMKKYLFFYLVLFGLLALADPGLDQPPQIKYRTSNDLFDAIFLNDGATFFMQEKNTPSPLENDHAKDNLEKSVIKRSGKVFSKSVSGAIRKKFSSSSEISNSKENQSSDDSYMKFELRSQTNFKEKNFSQYFLVRPVEMVLQMDHQGQVKLGVNRNIQPYLVDIHYFYNLSKRQNNLSMSHKHSQDTSSELVFGLENKTKSYNSENRNLQYYFKYHF